MSSFMLTTKTETFLIYILLGCSSCTDQFLMKHYDLKMQGKSYIKVKYTTCKMSGTKGYDVLVGK